MESISSGHQQPVEMFHHWVSDSVCKRNSFYLFPLLSSRPSTFLTFDRIFDQTLSFASHDHVCSPHFLRFHSLPSLMPLNFTSHCAINLKGSIHSVCYRANWNRFCFRVSGETSGMKKISNVENRKPGAAGSGAIRGCGWEVGSRNCWCSIPLTYGVWQSLLNATRQHKSQISYPVALNQARKRGSSPRQGIIYLWSYTCNRMHNHWGPCTVCYTL